MIMSKLRPIAAFVLGSALLPACVAPSAKPQMTIKPVMEIQHAAGGSAAAQYERGKYYQTRGDVDLALGAYVQALTLDSRHLEARNAMATIYSQQGRFAEAESMLREGVAQSPSAAYLHNNLGYIHYLQGNHEAAIKELRTAISLDPKNEWARNNLERAREALAQRPDNAQRPDKLAGHTKSPSAPTAVTVTPLENWGEFEGVPAKWEPTVSESSRNKSAIASLIVAAQNSVATEKNAFRLEISNGSGVPGLAKRLSRRLSRLGIAVFRITNQKPYRQIVTEIQYKDDFKLEAEKLKDTLRGHAVVAQIDTSRRQVDIRVVLGKDIKTHIAKIEKEEPTRLAISKPGTEQLE